MVKVLMYSYLLVNKNVISINNYVLLIIFQSIERSCDTFNLRERICLLFTFYSNYCLWCISHKTLI